MLMKSCFLFLLFIFTISYAYKANPTQYICTNSSSQTLPSCLPGYMIDIENVIHESTRDNTCSGTILCQIENKNTLLFACNRKRTCQIDLNDLRFPINSTCGTTIRFFVQYRCLPVIQEQKDYLCESSTSRRPSSGDINLSCGRSYRLYITMAFIGLSLKQDDTKTRFKCNKDTQTICNTLVPNGYRDVCDSQSKQECKITYDQRPMLKDCQYDMASNFSLVEYSCIPDDGIGEDLPRIDICSKEISKRLPTDRGLLHSPNYPEGLGQYLSCKKELFLPRESRLRLFMLEKSLEYSHELNIYLLNNIQTLAQNELVDVNITNEKKEQVVTFELKTNHVGDGQFLLYFQVDSRISEYAPYVLEPGRKAGGDRWGKLGWNRIWGIVIGCILVLLLILLIIFIIIRISKRRHERSLRYLKNDDDHHQQLNAPPTSSNPKGLQVERPYLVSSSPTILPPSSNNNNNRPHSASSTTSSIIMHQIHDGISDRESLIKPIGQNQTRPNTDIDNFYEEIKEQQQQTALALGINGNKGDLNPYLEAKSFEQKTPIFQGQQTVQPIRDHRENEPRYQHPQPSNVLNQQIKRPKKPPPKAPPQPSAPPLHLLENND